MYVYTEYGNYDLYWWRISNSPLYIQAKGLIWNELSYCERSPFVKVNVQIIQSERQVFLNLQKVRCLMSISISIWQSLDALHM